MKLFFGGATKTPVLWQMYRNFPGAWLMVNRMKLRLKKSNFQSNGGLLLRGSSEMKFLFQGVQV